MMQLNRGDNMGRYIACGIACGLYIQKKRSTSMETFNKLKNDINKNISNIINLDDYESNEYEEELCFQIKENFVNNNIYDFIKEINNVLNIKSYFLYNLFSRNKTIDVNSEDFNNQNYKMEFHYFDDNYNYQREGQKEVLKNKYAIISNDDYLLETMPFYTENNWIFSGQSDIIENVNIHTIYLMVWIDTNKIYGEDLTSALNLLNIFSRNYFKNPLGKDVHFFIDG